MNQQQSSHLDQSLRNYYGEKKLPDSLFDQLMASRTVEPPATTETTENDPVRKSLFLPRLTGLASLALTLGLGIGLLFQTFHGNNPSADLVFAEIAINQHKQLTVEFHTESFQQLSSLMTRLEFPLNKPPELSGQYELVGGGYCSIQGQLAAQLKLINRENNATETLYITRLNDQLRSVDNGLRTEHGISIQTWRDGQLFYALAK